MIALLLFCFKSWSQDKDSISSFTGEIQLIDSAKCIVPIELIRQANGKLIERIEFAKLICHQDSIITFQKFEIKEYKSIVVDMQSRIIDANKINEDLQNAIIKQRRKNKILIGAGCGLAAITIITLLCK